MILNAKQQQLSFLKCTLFISTFFIEAFSFASSVRFNDQVEVFQLDNDAPNSKLEEEISFHFLNPQVLENWEDYPVVKLVEKVRPKNRLDFPTSNIIKNLISGLSKIHVYRNLMEPSGKGMFENISSRTSFFIYIGLLAFMRDISTNSELFKLHNPESFIDRWFISIPNSSGIRSAKEAEVVAHLSDFFHLLCLRFLQFNPNIDGWIRSKKTQLIIQNPQDSWQSAQNELRKWSQKFPSEDLMEKYHSVMSHFQQQLDAHNTSSKSRLVKSRRKKIHIPLFSTSK